MLLVERSARQKLHFACRVESVDDFVRAHEILPIEDIGVAFGPFRKRIVFDTLKMSFSVVERHGYRGFHAPALKDREVKRARMHRQVLRTRQRHFRTDAAGLATLSRLVTAAEAELGREWTAALFIQSEVEFWMSRCAAGRFQATRLANAGLGWSTLRQLTYACSREALHPSLALFRMLGFSGIHEDYLGGAATFVLAPEPGLGLPNIVLMADSDGIENTLARCDETPSPLTTIGPAGLWCGLFGQSLLAAGPVAAHVPCATGSEAHSGDTALAQNPGALCTELTPIDPQRVRALVEKKLISGALGEDLRLNGSVGPRLFTQSHSICDVLQHERNCVAADISNHPQPGRPRARRSRRPRDVTHRTEPASKT